MYRVHEPIKTAPSCKVNYVLSLVCFNFSLFDPDCYFLEECFLFNKLPAQLRQSTILDSLNGR